MENTISRRNAILGMAAFGASALGCTHRNARKDEVAVADSYSSLDEAVEGANSFAEDHKEDLKLSHAELSSAAKQYRSIGELAANYKGDDKDKQVEAAKEAQQKLLGVIDYGLSKGEGYVGIEINSRIQRGAGVKNESYAHKTQITSTALADILNAEQDNGVLKKEEVLGLVANVQPTYQGFPEDRTLDISEVAQRGHMVIGTGRMNRIKQFLAEGDFEAVKSGALDYTSASHQLMSGRDIAQGVYNKKMPAALQLVMTKLPGYKAIQQKE